MSEIAPYDTRYARSAMVCTVDHLAASAGLGALRDGGTAVDAVIAANAVLTVTAQHQCGLGGDLFALVHRDGDEQPAVLNASGRAGSGADPDRLRSAGHATMPRTHDVACVPVPGCVDGWLTLHARFGRTPLADLLEPARRYAADGFPASPGLAAAYGEVAGLADAADYTVVGELRAGTVVRRPGVARTLAAIVREGRAGFYEGEFGDGLIALGAGEYTEEDLAVPGAEWVEPLGVDAFGRRVWTAPPNSQGYLTLAAAWIADGLELPDPDEGGWAHLLVEAARQATRDRDDVLHEGADAGALLAPERLAAMRASIDPLRAAAPLSADGAGGTVSVCVVDGEGMGVSLLQSNYTGWGSMLIVPEVRIFLHCRGSGFSLVSGHPAEYGPGRRPPHTLAPALVTGMRGGLDAVLATRGGHNQPQVLVQLMARLYRGGRSPGDAIAAARWSLAGAQVALEGQAPVSWDDALRERGHRVVRRPAFDDEFGHAQLITVRDDHLAGAADPRSLAGAAAGL